MPTRKSNPKQLEVDGRSYVYWVPELPYDEAEAVPLNVVVRAEFGTRSLCTISGLKNRSRWHDYPEWRPELAISITPSVVCELVRFAHQEGWEPRTERANFEVAVDNSLLGKISKPPIDDDA